MLWTSFHTRPLQGHLYPRHRTLLRCQDRILCINPYPYTKWINPPPRFLEHSVYPSSRTKITKAEPVFFSKYHLPASWPGLLARQYLTYKINMEPVARTSSPYIDPKIKGPKSQQLSTTGIDIRKSMSLSSRLLFIIRYSYLPPMCTHLIRCPISILCTV